MKIEEIKTIVKLMSENDLTEFKIEAEDMHLCIKRGGQNANPIIAQTLSPVVAAPELFLPRPFPLRLLRLLPLRLLRNRSIQGRPLILRLSVHFTVPPRPAWKRLSSPA